MSVRNAIRRILGRSDAHADRRVEPTVRFVAALTGPGEAVLHAALVAELRQYPEVSRAYLARALFGTKAGEQPVLCLRGPEDVGLVQRVGARFAELFSSDQHMDIVFLTEELEGQVERVSRPFYVSTPRN